MSRFSLASAALTVILSSTSAEAKHNEYFLVDPSPQRVLPSLLEIMINKQPEPELNFSTNLQHQFIAGLDEPRPPYLDQPKEPGEAPEVYYVQPKEKKKSLPPPINNSSSKKSTPPVYSTPSPQFSAPPPLPRQEKLSSDYLWGGVLLLGGIGLTLYGINETASVCETRINYGSYCKSYRPATSYVLMGGGILSSLGGLYFIIR